MLQAAGILYLHGEPHSGRVLLLRYAGGDGAGTWTIPGGGAEEGESAEEAAIREAREEAGADVPTGPLVLHARTQSDGVDFVTFLCRVPEMFSPVLSDEHDLWEWKSVSGREPARADGFGGQFEETEHPRAQGGKFTSKGGGDAPAAKEGKPAESPVEGKGKPTEGLKRDGKSWVTESGEAIPEHVAALKIPPAWTDVRINRDPKADLLVTGKDSKGRPTSIYSQRFVDERAAEKFSRIVELDRKFGTISEQNAANRANASDEATIDSADCLSLIMAMGVRPGSETDTGAKVKAYGATTLEGRHVVSEEGKGVWLRFTGKKGVALDLQVTDEALAKALTERASNAGPSGKLFPATSDGKLLDYVHSLDGGGFKTKDFRTRLGTATAHELVGKMPAPKNEAEYKKAVLAVAKQVSVKLGNTAIVALQSYISPTVFMGWRAGL